jgi:signal transduction histidine kinase/CheY-like chemotaxis protein
MNSIFTLLILDDSISDRRLYRRYLDKDPYQSYHILEASTADEGLSLVIAQQLDVLLLDFHLPDMDGLEFLAELNQLQLEKLPPVVMLTGQGNELLAVQAMKLGIQDYLAKDHLKSDVLCLAVRNAIQQAILKQQLTRTHERQQLIAATALRIRQTLNLDQILTTAVQEARDLFGCRCVAVYKFDTVQTGKIVASAGVDTNSSLKLSSKELKFLNLSHQYLVGLDGHDHQTEALLCLNLDSPACQVISLTLVRNGKPDQKAWGLLIAQHHDDAAWSKNDVDILFDLSVQLAIAIQQAEMLAQTQAALVKEQQFNTFKSEVVATVSHEYRTPLASILAAATTLKLHQSKLETERQERILTIIELKARHLSKLVENMLLINQAELNQLRFNPYALDLSQFFSDLLNEYQISIGSHYNLVFESSGNTQDFQGDQGLLRVIFDNLMSNAVKYSSEGSRIHFFLTGDESSITFSVHDQGIGIPQGDVSKLFQMFSRASNVSTIPGSGLGLAIIKSCVELHGGSINLESQEGLGSQVTISLPKSVAHQK